MTVDWDEVQRTVFPLKGYEDGCQRWRESFAYSFVCEAYNFSMIELVDYTQRLLGGDSRRRYTQYCSMLISITVELQRAGVQNVLDLLTQVETRQKLEEFTGQRGVHARDIAALLKYLIYWIIPMKKYLSGLVGNDPSLSEAAKILRGVGVRTNLDMLEQGLSKAGRKTLAEAHGLPEAVISSLTNRADFSRMPWASKATISNIIGAGYGSLAELANAEPETLYADFFEYGKSIGKNLKLGNEIESSYRIAKIVPLLVQNE